MQPTTIGSYAYLSFYIQDQAHRYGRQMCLCLWFSRKAYDAGGGSLWYAPLGNIVMGTHIAAQIAPDASQRPRNLPEDATFVSEIVVPYPAAR